MSKSCDVEYFYCIAVYFECFAKIKILKSEDQIFMILTFLGLEI